MPCNSDYMEANSLEREISKVHCLLDELDGKEWSNSDWNGYHPKVYCRVNRELADKLVRKLCSKLKTADVTKYSLEMQMWWRDHQEADAAREQHEQDKKIEAEKRAAALAKLTDEEKELLGL